MKNPQKLAFLEVVGGLVLGLLARLAGAVSTLGRIIISRPQPR